MSEKKIVAVVGATGAQGGGVVDALLDDPGGGFRVRALTRNPDSDKARALQARGAEVVPADADDPESLAAAFAGAHGAFCVTNYWEHFSTDRELAQARALAEAARDSGLRHVVWSTLEDTRRFMALDDPRMPTLLERYKVPHLDAKGEANRFFEAAGVPTTYFHTSFYWDNLIHFGMGPKPGPDGRLAFVLPMADKLLPGIAAGDIGRCAYGVFQRGAELVGQSVGVAGEHLTGAQMAAALAQALGQPVVYNYVPPEIYRTFDFPGADDLANMFQFKRDFQEAYLGLRDLKLSRELYPGLQTFAQWLETHKARIPLS